MYNKYTHKKFYHRSDIDETKYSEIAYERKAKLEKYQLLKSEKCSEESIFEVLDISRATFYRWKKRYRLYGLSGLEDESKVPINKRKSTWSKEIENNIYHLRKKYSLWGKAKLAIAYKRKYNKEISVSMIGRVIKKLISNDKIFSVNFLLFKKIKKNRVFNGHAKRLTLGMKANKAGELIQIDHMTVSVPGHGQLNTSVLFVLLLKLLYKNSIMKQLHEMKLLFYER